MKKRAIINKTRKVVLAKESLVCASIRSKAKGLMFTRASFVRKNSLIFPFGFSARQSLHMFFVFYPIDVLFLDEKGVVVDTKEKFIPFTFYRGKVPSLTVVELPQGTICSSRTHIGDRIVW